MSRLKITPVTGKLIIKLTQPLNIEIHNRGRINKYLVTLDILEHFLSLNKVSGKARRKSGKSK